MNNYCRLCNMPNGVHTHFCPENPANGSHKQRHVRKNPREWIRGAKAGFRNTPFTFIANESADFIEGWGEAQTRLYDIYLNSPYTQDPASAAKLGVPTNP